MSELEVKIPFVDIIEVIMTLEKNEQHKEANTLVKDIIRSYSGDYNMLQEDIDYIFFGDKKGIVKMSEEWPKEYKILKKLFGGLIWSD